MYIKFMLCWNITGELKQTDDQPQVNSPPLRTLHHPQWDKDSWGDGESSGYAPTAL